jgi:hypothetical protein
MHQESLKSFHEKAGECRVGFSFSLSCKDVFVLLFSPCEFLPLSQAAPVATLPSGLFVERWSPGAICVLAIQ